jgi:hypothetical protein
MVVKYDVWYRTRWSEAEYFILGDLLTCLVRDSAPKISISPRPYIVDLVQIFCSLTISYFRSNAFVSKVATLACEIELLLHFGWKVEEGFVHLKQPIRILQECLAFSTAAQVQIKEAQCFTSLVKPGLLLVVVSDELGE